MATLNRDLSTNTYSMQPPTDTRSLVDIYNARPDLQQAFPQGTVSGTNANRQLNDWWNQRGSIEYPGVSLGQPIQSGRPLPDSSSSVISSQTSQNDPLTIFNQNMLQMLKEAQGTSGNDNLYQQQARLGQTGTNIISAQTPSNQLQLSPQQQEEIRQGKVNALTPEIDAVGARIKANDARLQNFENILRQYQGIGTNLINLSPSKDVIEGYKNIIRAGGDITSIPEEIRNKVLAGIKPEDWAAYTEAKKGLIEASKYSPTPYYDFNTNKTYVYNVHTKNWEELNPTGSNNQFSLSTASTAGNNPVAYAQAVANQLGVYPTDTLNKIFLKGGVEPLMQAMATHEGFSQSGSRAQRNNNPGNLMFAGQTGATRDADGFAKFNTLQEGWDAMRRQILLNMGKPGGDTLQGMINMWLGSSSSQQKNSDMITNPIIRNGVKNLENGLTLDQVEKTITGKDKTGIMGQIQNNMRILHNDWDPRQAYFNFEIGKQNIKQEALTSPTRTMIETAPTVKYFVDRIQKEVQDAQNGLGPLSSRWREFTAGKIGLDDPSFTALRTNVGLLQTALVKMHFGSRGGEHILERFENLINSGKQSPANLQSALNEIGSYADEVASRGKNNQLQSNIEGKIKIISPSGVLGYIPANRLQDYLNNGYKQQ